MRKTKDIFLLTLLLGIAGALILFSADAKRGATDGFILAQNTIIPSLMPLLIIFLIIMKTSAKNLLAKGLGFISHYLFNLPYVTFPAIFLGLVGGYPTGALLTRELFDSAEIDEKQAKAMLRFNFCGGAGFIITAVGTSVLKSTRAGMILFFSSVLSSFLIGFCLSFTDRRNKDKFYSFPEHTPLGDVLSDATSSAVNSVLGITAFIILFSAIAGILPIPEKIMPVIEITNGICGDSRFPLELVSAYLSFGGVCIHFQLLGTIKHIGMKLADFVLFRVIGAVFSYIICHILLMAFPVELAVFSNTALPVEASSVNISLSVLMIVGCFVIIMDINSKRALANAH